MQPISYETPDRATVAIAAARQPDSLFVAGGTTVFDLMKLNVLRAKHLVDVTRLDMPALHSMKVSADTIWLGAMVRMADLATHAEIKAICPMIAQSLDLGASQQIRNMARLGGNVLQRTRCAYYREPSFAQCNRRNPGSGCAARDGHNRQHAVLGASNACIAVYPGDFPQTLIALDATVHTLASGAKVREFPFAQLHRLPGARPDIETVLQPGELIVGFSIRRGAWMRRSLYLKIRDRQSYAFALSSAAVALELTQQGIVNEARIALGGVATVPWRAHEAEAVLKASLFSEDVARRAARAAFQDATVHSDNAYKLPLGEQTLVRALLSAAALEVSV
ncbi:xanthine dehydrogenase family protein subunit M [Pandoraea fibrosis]|uniref:Xanthine dehydrogenase family protein subunit M n=2 Tax=Pandoraea fibrosis TaxID=1891094 RepID=A0ABX6HYB9_9BURK|nr:xanthine dehydrogenase family protein subunit M [Pandoraea fibrosis]QHF15936.1 xanthine dehydrogenase family protein subunit M [Pandoraea fibrosis]